MSIQPRPCGNCDARTARIEHLLKRIAELEVALKLSTDKLTVIAIASRPGSPIGLVAQDRLDAPTIRCEVERQKAMERVVSAAQKALLCSMALTKDCELVEALADLEKLDAK